MQAVITTYVRDLSARRLSGRGFIATLALTAGLLLAAAATALAAPVWRLDSLANSTATPGGRIAFHVQISNIGLDPADGTGGDPIVFTASLPAGMTADSVAAPTFFGPFDWSFLPGWTCSGDGPGPAPGIAGAREVRCAIADSIAARDMRIAFGPAQPIVTAEVDAGAGGRTLTTVFGVSGAGAAAPASTAEATRITDDPPAFGADSFDAQVTKDATGAPLTQAGGHPYAATVTLDFNTSTNANPLLGDLWPVAAPKDVSVDLPPGFVGDPTVAEQCTNPELAGKPETSFAPSCPPASQIGTVVLRTSTQGQGSDIIGPLALFNLVPPPDKPARFGFNVQGSVVTMTGQVRSDSDYGLTVTAEDVPEGLAAVGTTITIWGVPASDDHTSERECKDFVSRQYILVDAPTCQNGGDLLPFLRNPTSCSGADSGLPIGLRMDSWQEPGRFVSDAFRTHDSPGYPRARDQWGPERGTTGCDRVPFDPTLRVTPGTPARAGAPTGFAFDLAIPQTKNPDTIGQADLRTAVVTLPEGMRVSPSSAEGLGACTPAQIGLHRNEDPTCPPSSKVGDVTITTPLLNDPLGGAIYLGAPHDNPFGTLISLYLVVRGPGFVVKLPGKVETNADTGQLTATFDDNPQLPVSNVHLAFSDGPRSPLVTPDQCGTYTVHAAMIGWNGGTATSDSSFSLAQDADGTPCKAHGFNPGFNAGTDNPSAGKPATFHLRVTRPDQDQRLAGLTVKMPEGLTGYVSHVDLCGELDAAHGTCPAAAKIGDVTVGSGAGSNPFYITNGRAYLTGPYKGAPYGVAIVVPAVAGPFDLGNVNVRSALYVDKHDSTLRVVSDPLPTILEGIPLDVRDVRVAVDKPGFIINPTSCATKQVGGTIVSTLAATARVSARFQVGDCASLGFKPRMVMRVGGRGHTRRGQTSPFTTTLTMPKRNQANLRFVRVTLPDTINARLNTIQDACTRAEFETDVAKCAHAKAGTAVASTPLLRAPLRGSVYFVKNGHAIPDLFVALRGQVAFDLIGRISIVNNRLLRTTFATAPDVPIRSFTLRLLGGRSTASIGALVNLCSANARRATAAVDYIAQNGRVLQVNEHLHVAGCGGGGRHLRR